MQPDAGIPAPSLALWAHRAPDRVPADVVAAIVAYRNACYRAKGDDVLNARIALERAILGALVTAWDGGEAMRAARQAVAPPTDGEVIAWLDETAEAGDNMADTYRESAAAGNEHHALDLEYWEREARCARAVRERLAARAAASDGPPVATEVTDAA